MRDRHWTQAGFTLIEVIVALAILAMTLGVVFQSFSLGLRGIGASEAYAKGRSRSRRAAWP